MKATGSTVTEICRDLDKSEAIYRRWVKHCGDISRSGARHCKALQEENAKLRRLLGEAKREKHCSRIARRENSHPARKYGLFITHCPWVIRCAVPAALAECQKRRITTRALAARLCMGISTSLCVAGWPPPSRIIGDGAIAVRG
mgnify:CR=1 FL=1